LKEVRVKIGDRWYTVEVEEPLGSPARVTVEGETFLVEVDTGESRRSPARTFRPGLPAPATRTGPPVQSAADDGVIKSPMSGKVLAIRVKPGAKVASGDEVCVVEAMKMEQSIRAPKAGTVKKIHVKPLDQVQIHAPLVELD
jgi:biotin carboxyl carrier protein